MNWKKKILIGIGILIVAAGVYAYREYTRKNKDLSTVSADFKMNAHDLVAAFEKNELRSNEQFLDKVIQIDGTVKEIIKDEKGYYTISLGDEGISSVRCSMDTVHSETAAAVVKGSSVRIKGVCTGFNSDDLLGSDVILNRCVVSK